MQGITFDTSRFIIKQVHPVRERNDVINLFLVEINKAREGTKFKPATFMSVRNKCAAMQDVGQLYAFYEDCKKKDSFSKYFYWATNPKKHESKS